MLYDAHTHLNDPKLYPQVTNLLKNFVKIGGKGLVNIGVDDQRNQRALDIAKNNDLPLQIGTAIWYHPDVVIRGQIDIAKQIDKLKKQIEQNHEYVRAIGEIGIDLYRGDEKNLKAQKQLFAQQLDLAQELNLGVVIHSRESFEATRDVLQNYTNLKIYFHSWTYTPSQLQKLLKYPNIRIGFNGILTYPKAQQVRESLKQTPLEKILLETDAPYLAPVPQRGKTNEPAYICYIYQFASKLINLDEQQLQQQIQKNWHKFYS